MTHPSLPTEKLRWVTGCADDNLASYWQADGPYTASTLHCFQDIVSTVSTIRPTRLQASDTIDQSPRFQLDLLYRNRVASYPPCGVDLSSQFPHPGLGASTRTLGSMII